LEQKTADSFLRKTDAKTPQTGAKISKRTQNRKSGHLLNSQNSILCVVVNSKCISSLAVQGFSFVLGVLDA
jgi:hypothetical protein